MNISLKGLVAGAVALGAVAFAGAEAQAMPAAPALGAPTAEAHVEPAYYYGYRRPFLYRRFGYVRPYGYYGYRRFGYVRPFYRRFGYVRPYGYYGYRRF